MTMKLAEQHTGCERCREGGRAKLNFDFTMAFQPIVDVERGQIFAQEALVRGLNGEGAGQVLSQVDEQNRYAFDQACRTRAIKLAAGQDPSVNLSINFLPNAVYEPANCIRATLSAARKHDFPLEQIIFEITEGERVAEVTHLRDIVTEYKRQGFRVAIDDFGDGHSGLGLLADLQPDLIKLDMGLVRGIDSDPTRQAILRGTLITCADLGIGVIGEGVETEAEFSVLRDLGVRYLQGFLLARPAFEAMTTMDAVALPAALV
jgi:EAL domain-containing protein (putative c-di-GMP-specific phosphodiesterase class I)